MSESTGYYKKNRRPNCVIQDAMLSDIMSPIKIILREVK